MSEVQQPVELSRELLQEAQKAFVGKLRRRSFPWCFIANEAEDVFAQAELELWAMVARGERVTNPAGWLVICAWHRAINRVDKEKNSPTVPVADEELERSQDERAGVAEEILRAEETEIVHRAQQELTEEEQTLVHLVFYEELSVRAAAKRLGWTPSRAQRRKVSSEKKLRKRLSLDLESR